MAEQEPVIVVAKMQPKPGAREQVIAAMERAIPAVHGEPGCELYALHEADDHLLMIEKWASREALEAHFTAPALRELVAATSDLLAAPLEVSQLRPHPAGDDTKGAL